MVIHRRLQKWGLFVGFGFIVCLGLGSFSSWAEELPRKSHFKKVFIIVFENTSFRDTIKQPFFKFLAERGALFKNFSAETRPSQGNYIALVSGSTYDVRTDAPVTLDVSHVGDLLEAKGLSWKVYAESYPGNCYLGAKSGNYARKHVPFLSFKNIQENSSRCARINSSEELEKDIQNGSLPEYSLFIPNNKSNGHDTGVAYADRWFASRFKDLLDDSRFMSDLLLIVTFDEAGFVTGGGKNIYTVAYGDSVIGGIENSTPLNHYSILRLIEDEWGLGSLNQNDLQASLIENIWK
ncbi:MAG: hypothetical protein IPJ71_10160 [Bdellovibrionales bacterium]|nr:hypothetical protein [Bdellovibrionales bacterium]